MSHIFPLAFSTLGCPGWTLEQAAAFAEAHGYAALELRLLDGELIPADLPAPGRRRIVETLRRHGLGCVGVGASTRFSSADPDERAANADELRRHLRLAHAIGAPLVRTYGGQMPIGTGDEQAVAWVVAGLEAALPEAERLGVSIAIETHDSFSRGALVAQVLKRLPHPRLGAIWDVLHPLRFGEPAEITWGHLRPRLLHVHIKDGRPDPARAPEDWRLVPLGAGAVPAQAILRMLVAGGYAGMLSVEWEKHWHPELAEPELALPQHAAQLRAWMEDL